MPIQVRGSFSLGESSSGGGGAVLYGGTDLSSSATTEDEYSLFPNIRKTTSTSETNLFTLNVPEIDVGTYSIMIRLKTSVLFSSNIIKITTVSQAIQDETNSKTQTNYITGSMLKEINKFDTLGYVFNIDTKSPSTLQIKADLLTVSGVTVSIDYVSISPTFTTISAIA